jgi:hypothetical protein
MRPSIGWLPFVVALVFHLALSELAQAQSTEGELATQAVPESLRALRFTAVHRVAGISYSDAASFGEFSLEGPVIHTLTPCASAHAVPLAGPLPVRQLQVVEELVDEVHNGGVFVRLTFLAHQAEVDLLCLLFVGIKPRRLALHVDVPTLVGLPEVRFRSSHRWCLRVEERT